MKQYQTTPGGSFQIDNMTIPLDPANSDYQRMLAEVAANEAELLPVPAPTLAAFVVAIKEEAGRRIFATYPLTKQLNMTARATELLNIARVRSWTQEEGLESDLLAGAWAWIKTVRAKSNELEADVAFMSDDERRTFDVRADENWS